MKNAIAVCISLLLLAGTGACSGSAEESAPQQTTDASLPDASGPDAAAEDSATQDAPPDDAAQADAEVSPGSVTLRFRNTFTTDIYLDWSWSDKPQPLVSREQGEALALGNTCTMPCSDQCVCVMCDMPPPRAKKLAPNAFVEFSWDGLWYEFRHCGDANCNCHEVRYVAPGDFSASLKGALAISGGTPDPQDPTLINDASLDTSAGFCTASGDFALPSTAVVEIPFACAVP